jgi:hypothetical protein
MATEVRLAGRRPSIPYRSPNRLIAISAGFVPALENHKTDTHDHRYKYQNNQYFQGSR